MFHRQSRGPLTAVVLIAAGAAFACGPSNAPLDGGRRATTPALASSPPASGTAGSNVGVAARLPGEVTAMAAGRYRSNPPFDMPFTFEVPDGWTCLHLHGEYVDIGWYAGRSPFGLPDRVLGFARPQFLRGVDGDEPARNLTAAEAMAVFRGRSDIVTTEPISFELDGRAGLRLDIHALAESTSLLGGDEGTLGVGPAHDSRLGVVSLANGDLLVVIVQAPPAELHASWTRVAPILESVDLEEG